MKDITQIKGAAGGIMKVRPALSPEQAATIKALKAAWYCWSESGRQGTAWEFILWYEKRLRVMG